MSEVIQSGSLNGEIRAEETLHGSIEPEATLEGSISMPKTEEVVKLANAPKISELTLLAAAWVGEGNLYHQVVDVEGATENSQVDLTPSVDQLLVFYEKDLTFVTENEDGVVTVYAIGQKPTNDYTIQVTITEVEV